MTRAVILPSKRVSDEIPVEFPFLDQMQFGEVLIAASVTVSLFSGDDPNPSAILSGTTTITNTVATQLITGGLAGVIYLLTCLCITNTSHQYSKIARLAVLSDDWVE